MAYKFFSSSENSPYVICKLCNSTLKCWTVGNKLGTSTMVRHLRRKHPKEMSKTPVASLVAPTKSSFATETERDYFVNNQISQEDSYINSVSPTRSDEIKFNPKDLKLIHPFSLIISGPTSSGKSTVLFKILENLHQNTDTTIQKVVFIYGVYQEVFENYPNIFFTDDLDYMDIKPDVPTIIILDDVMSTVNNSKKLEELFTRGVHHRKISVILTLQNLFYHGSVMKTLRDNAMYVVLTKHIQDVAKLDTFARQLERKNSNYFKDSYADATSRKYGYLICDLHPHSELRDGPHQIKYRSLIHKPEGQVLYLPKDQGNVESYHTI